MRRAMVILLIAGLLAGFVAAQRAEEPPGVSFATVPIFLDSGDQPLAVYQIEFQASDRRVVIVGIEGGEHPAFTAPPYYDPAAMQTNRAILAAYSTNAQGDLPTGRTRIATLHLQVPAGIEWETTLKLTTAANAAGQRIEATATLRKGIEP